APDPSGSFGQFAYVTNFWSNNITMYSIDATSGALTSIGAVAAPPYPTSIAVDPTGRFASATSAPDWFNPGTVSMYSIHPATATLSPLGTVAMGINPWSVVVDRSDSFVYVANLAFLDFSLGSLSTYGRDATSGLLSPGETFVFDSGDVPPSMAVDPFS